MEQKVFSHAGGRNSPGPHGFGGFWPQREAAFTLIELLACVGIILVLAALLFPVANRMNASAKQNACISNLRTIGSAHAQYSAENNGAITPNRSNEGAIAYFWNQELAAYIMGGKRLGTGGGNPPAKCKTFHCPAAKNPSPPDALGYSSVYVEKSSYGQNLLIGGGNESAVTANGYPRNQRRQTIEKPSKMVLVAETPAVNIASYSFEGAAAGPTRHNGTSNLLFVDGHVESAAYPVTPERGNKTYNWSIGNETN
ncbi:MAG TPA: prepilin-type N-terminal cleavage/methylation domain-containing protein [Terrimicrobiaceae bacterium]|nr:prepilin-type N-terminal cleavage/methylation domain-containing protein [Terrimicrobiaceae bacterium]